MEDCTTVYVASYNTRPYTELCVRSLHRYADRRFDLVVGDSGSRDGSAEMLAGLAREGWLRVETSPTPRSHAMWLDLWLATATAQHIVFCDSDIEFLHRGFLGDMQRAAGRGGTAFVSAALRRGRSYADSEILTRTMPRPTVWLMMVNVGALRPLHTSFEKVSELTDAYTEGQRTFDVGSLLYHRAVDAGMRHVGLGWRFRRKYRHYGNASWGTPMPIGRIRRRAPMPLVEGKLEACRRVQGSPSSLVRMAGRLLT